MQCPSCGTNNPSNSPFCGGCGQKLETKSVNPPPAWVASSSDNTSSLIGQSLAMAQDVDDMDDMDGTSLEPLPVAAPPPPRRASAPAPARAPAVPPPVQAPAPMPSMAAAGYNVRYEYSMVQVPPNIEVRGRARGQEAAIYLQDICNQNAAQGWEFYRVDTIGVLHSPGCLAALFGQRSVAVNYYVITFRRPR